MNVLIHQAALGDFVLTWPLLRALPGPWRVVAPWSMAKLAAVVAAGVKAVDIEGGGWHRLHVEDAEIPQAVADVLQPADRIISFTATADSVWATNVRRIAPQARLHVVASRPPSGWRGHVCDWHRHQLAAQGLCLSPVQPRPGGKADGPVVVHPGSGGADKCWPADRFEALMAHVRGRARKRCRIPFWSKRYPTCSVENLDLFGACPVARRA
jgi:heptosyltransferase III